MTFAIKANLSFTTAEVPTQPVKPKTDVPSTPVNTEQPAANPVNKEQQPAATAKIDPAAAEKKAIETIQNLASQYGIKTGNLSTEEGRAKAVTDMWMKINNNVEKARLSKDPADLQAANTAKSAFLDQLKDARGAGWNFGLRELVQSAAPKGTSSTVPPKPTNAPVEPTTPNTPVNNKSPEEGKTEKPTTVQSSKPVINRSEIAKQVEAFDKDAAALLQDAIAFKTTWRRTLKEVNSGSNPNGTAAVDALSAQVDPLLARYDSLLVRAKDLRSREPNIDGLDKSIELLERQQRALAQLRTEKIPKIE